MGDKTKGIYKKFIVTREDGRDKPGEKHCGCEYFVLDLNHDVYAKAALLAYAKACEDEYPELAADLYDFVRSEHPMDACCKDCGSNLISSPYGTKCIACRDTQVW